MNQLVNNSFKQLQVLNCERICSCPVVLYELSPAAFRIRDFTLSLQQILNNSIYIDDYDIYNRNTLNNIFYTVPNNNIINDQEGFAKWLYRDNETCKEEGGIECYNNLYTDLRVK